MGVKRDPFHNTIVASGATFRPYAPGRVTHPEEVGVRYGPIEGESYESIIERLVERIKWLEARVDKIEPLYQVCVDLGLIDAE